jgi:hypothetical protein
MTVVLPFVNSALASRVAFRRGVASLRAEGVRMLFGPGVIPSDIRRGAEAT